MLIKTADDRSGDIDTLRGLAQRPDASFEVRQMIEREMRNIQSGLRGEAEAAYEMEFHYGASKNWMIIHDLRLECEGRVAQIDHLLLNRWLEIYVCESKRFQEGVGINELGEFSAFNGGKAYGIPSPIEQNRRHIAVLNAVFKSEQVKLPKRLGLAIRPSLMGLVLVSKTARISRPKVKVKDIDCVIKNDQLKAKINRDIDKDYNILAMAKLIGQDTLEDFARRLAAAHRPITFDWSARFNLSAAPLTRPCAIQAAPTTQEATPLMAESEPPAAAPKEVASEERPSKLICSSCEAFVSVKVARFCWFNKPRFGGKVYCFGCQKAIPAN